MSHFHEVLCVCYCIKINAYTVNGLDWVVCIWGFAAPHSSFLILAVIICLTY
jgi:hypothetical protein